MELLPSVVTRGPVSDFFDYTRGPYLRSSWYWTLKELVKEFWKGVMLGMIGVGLFDLGAHYGA